MAAIGSKFPQYESNGDSSSEVSMSPATSDSETEGLNTRGRSPFNRGVRALTDSPRRSLAHRLLSQEPQAADDTRCITGQKALLYLLVILFDCGVCVCVCVRVCVRVCVCLCLCLCLRLRLHLPASASTSASASAPACLPPLVSMHAHW